MKVSLDFINEFNVPWRNSCDICFACNLKALKKNPLMKWSRCDENEDFASLMISGPRSCRAQRMPSAFIGANWKWKFSIVINNWIKNAESKLSSLMDELDEVFCEER